MTPHFRHILARSRGLAAAAALGALAAGCGSADVDPPPAAKMTAADLRAPPIGGAAVEAWLREGAYKGWHCEPAIHSARSPSLHGLSRICVNETLAETPGEAAAWPRGSARPTAGPASLSTSSKRLPLQSFSRRKVIWSSSP